MDTEQVAKLREEFPEAAVGRLPRVTCKDCSKASGRVCSKHQKSRCNFCRNFITSAHIDLDYVGHAEVTDRLLSVDPEWTWEPFALDDDGLPRVRQCGNETELWIRLTVCGVTRPGVGSVITGSSDEAKQLIGDALRNAAMRFGVALYLWSKSDLESSLSDPEPSVEHMAKKDIDGLVERVKALPAKAQADIKARMAEAGITLAWPVTRSTFDSIESWLPEISEGAEHPPTGSPAPSEEPTDERKEARLSQSFGEGGVGSETSPVPDPTPRSELETRAQDLADKARPPRERSGMPRGDT